jgi:deoxyribonuclease-2
MGTVNQLYDSNMDLNNVAYALYNDDPPPPLSTASSSYAHAKGVILTNATQGFWLIHSKPNWPNARSAGAGTFPDTTFSQSLMCITFNIATFDVIAMGNMINNPFLYDSYISTSLASVIPNFSLWLQKQKSTTPNMTYTLTSSGGAKYTQFAKSKSWNRDLYDDFVAPTLKSPINVETWRSGSGGR